MLRSPQCTAILALLALPTAGAHAAWTETVLTSFNFQFSDEGPFGGLVADADGNLYGTTDGGGPRSDGTAFRLTPPAAGQTAWTYTIILSFDGKNGSQPAAGLIFDPAGNLYGTTTIGGAHGNGTVFRLAPPAAGKTKWRETVLFSFDVTNGQQPDAALALDTEGNLYGTTVAGGANGDGTVFKLAPPAAGKTKWRQTVLFSFNNADGANPEAAVILDAAGNLYGTTRVGGTANDGTVFELSPPAAGKKAWTETVLYAFTGPDGEAPQSTLLFDTAGNLYGTTSEGGANQCGTVFELTP
jgi:uncharacterized repeat protein (TIGR03803 family)